MSVRCVLVVDDNVDLRSTFVCALQFEGYDVFEAGNGQEALDFLLVQPKDQLPGSILLDFMMPVMDGPSFVSALLNTNVSAYRDIPIIVVTAKKEIAGPPRIPHTVATLQKPVDLDELYGAVGKYHLRA